MYTQEKLLKMLTKEKASVRYEAIEWIRVGQTSSPEIIFALQKAAQDKDKDVAERSALALQTEVHYHMQVEMGLISPYENKIIEFNNRRGELPKGQINRASVVSLISGIYPFIDILFLYLAIINQLHDSVTYGGDRRAAFILSFIVFSLPISAIIAIISGAISLFQISKSSEAGENYAGAGIGLGIMFFLIFLFLLRM